MNFINQYKKLIKKALGRQLPKDIITERHHPLPECIFFEKTTSSKDSIMPEGYKKGWLKYAC